MNLSFEKFCELASEFNLIPLFESLPADLETPVSAFLKLKVGQKHAFLLESVEGGQKWGRYSFLGVDPVRTFQLDGETLWQIEPRADKKTKLSYQDSPLEVLREGYVDYKVYQDPGLPRFLGGLVGYIGYDLVQSFEKVKIRHKDFAGPLLTLMHMDTLVIFDNLKAELKIVSSVSLQDVDDRSEDNLRKLYAQATSKIERVKNTLLEAAPSSKDDKEAQAFALSSNISKDQFLQNVAMAKEYIKAGDIMQVVLSLRFELDPVTVDPFQVYRGLRRLNPSPYMYYLECDDLKIVGASPEVLVRLEEGEIDVRPIAGTRKRGASSEEDKALEKDLLNDPKERAEHIMLLDLGRNDVGRVAETGSVKVDEDHVVEYYSHVMHLVSHVSGKMLAGCDMFDVMASTFPAGTLSGAPKVRAMEIIDELETSARGIYGGGVGYLSYSGNMDLAIAIRTAWFQDGKAYVQAGAGIVNDSDPEKEYEECCNKAKAMIKAIEGAV